MKYYLLYSALLMGEIVLLTSPRVWAERREFKYAVTIAISTGMAFFLWSVTIPDANYVDFTKAYYEAGRIIFTNPAGLYKGIQPEFVNIPIVAYLFSPFTMVEQVNAVRIMIVLSIIAVVGSSYCLIRLGQLQGRERLLFILLVMANGPLFYSVRLGNTTHFVLLLISVIMVLGDRKQFLAGSLAAICAIIKLPLTLFGFYYIFRKRWTMALGFWVTTVIILCCSVLIFGMDLHFKWYTEVIQRNVGKTMGAYNLQSINGFLAHLTSGNNLYSWKEFSTGWKFKVAQFAFLILMTAPVGWVLWFSKAPSSENARNVEFSIILCLSLLLSPISWIHYYLLLLAPLALLLEDGNFMNDEAARPKAIRGKGILIAAVVLISLPVVHTLPDSFVPDIPIIGTLCKRILVSHYFLGGILFLYCLVYSKINTLIIPKPFMVMGARDNFEKT